jgi:hypothetical protein
MEAEEEVERWSARYGPCSGYIWNIWNRRSRLTLWGFDEIGKIWKLQCWCLMEWYEILREATWPIFCFVGCCLGGTENPLQYVVEKGFNHLANQKKKIEERT